MKCLIVDDNPIARRALRELTSDVDFLEISGECGSAQAAFNSLEKTPIDLLFLDIEMPNMSGLEFLASLDRPPLVILITSKRDYAVEAFELRVADYLVKPVAPARFLTAVKRAKELFDLQNIGLEIRAADPHALFVRADNQLVRIVFDDLFYVSALGDYVQFFTSAKKYAVHSTMKAVEEALPTARFQRVHRSHLVNVEKIEAIEEGSTLIIQKQMLPIGEQFKATLLQRLRFL